MEEINNKNGYLVMGEEGYYSDREVEPYAYTKTEEEAIVIANEAVRQAKKRKLVTRDEYHHKKDNTFDRARIYNLDTMQKDGPLFLKSDTGGIHLIWERNGYRNIDNLYILYPGEKDDDDTYKARARKSRLIKIQENKK